MFDRFTDRSRKAMGVARQEAARLGHDFIGTEHILLGLLQVGGTAQEVLTRLGCNAQDVQTQVRSLASPGLNTAVTTGQLPFTPRAKKCLELALEESSKLGHTYIGTEHLLLGVIAENDGHAAQALRNLRVKAQDVRDEIVEILGEPPKSVADTVMEDVVVRFAGFPDMQKRRTNDRMAVVFPADNGFWVHVVCRDDPTHTAKDALYLGLYPDEPAALAAARAFNARGGA